MDVIPAVDIMGGKVVRLVRGDPKLAKSYEHLGDPLTLAKRWEAEGAQIIHIIDLDAALELGNNTNDIEKIVKAVDAKVQVGGGIRSLNAARHLLKLGVERVLLGSLAFKDAAAIKTLLDEFGKNRIIVALDNRDGVVTVRGWKTSAGATVEEAASTFSRLGVGLFLVTSVERDGTLAGPDFETLAKVCRLRGGDIAAGGIRSLDDLVALKRLGVCGTVIGKALYEGRFTLGEALKSVSGD